MKSLRVTLATLCMAVPAVAAAQKGPSDPAEGKKMAPIDDEAKPAEGGTDVEMEEDAPPEDMEGTSENPDAPRLVGDEDDVVTTAPKATRTGYPIEEVLRPLTLPAVTSEIGLELRSTFDGLNTEVGLRARYGITRQVQIGLRYGIGGLYEDVGTGDDKIVFNTGKAVGLDVSYLIKDWVAAKITLPVYVQPFAMAVTLGAPMKFRFGQRFAIVVLDDFLDIRISKFIPSLTDERRNEQYVALDESDTVLPTALIHARAGVIYQQSPQLAIKGNVAITSVQGTDDTSVSAKTPYAIEALVQYSPKAKMDLTVRAGFDDLASASESFGLMIAAAYRI